MVIKKADPKTNRRKKRKRGMNGITLNRKINEFGSDEDIGHVST